MEAIRLAAATAATVSVKRKMVQVASSCTPRAASRPQCRAQTLFALAHGWLGRTVLQACLSTVNLNHSWRRIPMKNRNQIQFTECVTLLLAAAFWLHAQTTLAFSLILNNNGGGVVLKSPDQADYPANATVMLTAIPASGWVFNGWSTDASGAINPLSVVMNKDKVIAANFVPTQSGCTPTPSGLVSWWPGDGNANDIVGINNGALIGNVTFQPGMVGMAFGFDGTGPFVQVPDSPSLNPAGDFSIAAWIKTSGTPNNSGVVSKGNVLSGGSGNNGYALEFSGNVNPGPGRLEFVLGDGAGNYTVARNSDVVTDGLWHYAVAVVSFVPSDPSHTVQDVKMYVDGVWSWGFLSDFTSYSPTTRPLWIGNSDSGTPTGRLFKGLIDEVSFYNRALSPSEIQTLYNSCGSCAPPPSGLVSWWPGAGNANDCVGPNDGVPGSHTTFPPGKIGRAFSFDGTTGGAITVSANASMRFTSQFTIEAWIKPKDVSKSQQILSWYGDGANNLSYEIGLTPGGVLELRVSLDGTGDTYFGVLSPSGLLANDTWAHVAGTFSSGMVTLYVNGAPVTLGTVPYSAIFSNATGPIGIGMRPDGIECFNGLIDDLAVYNRALSSDEIHTIFAAGGAGKCLTPVYIYDVTNSGNNLSVSWLAQKGMSYRGQYKNNLTDSAWQDIVPDLVATGGTATIIGSNLSNANQRFYRVLLLQ